jgi:hypothetical protein
VRRLPDRALKQVSDPILQEPVGWQADRVAEAFGFKEFVYLGTGESCVAPEMGPLHNAPVAGDHRLEHRAPAVGAVHKQRVITGAAEMAVLGAAFLLAIGRALARRHVEHDRFWRSPLVHLVDPLAGKIGKGSEVLGPAQPPRFEALNWLAEAADLVIARSPTTQRIAGSRHSQSASFTSSSNSR